MPRERAKMVIIRCGYEPRPALYWCRNPAAPLTRDRYEATPVAEHEAAAIILTTARRVGSDWRRWTEPVGLPWRLARALRDAIVARIDDDC